MRNKLLTFALLATLILCTMICIGTLNGSWKWPIFGTRISILHYYGLAVLAVSILLSIKQKKYD